MIQTPEPPAAAPVTSLTFEQMKALIEAGKDRITPAEIADIAASAAAKAKMPENRQHPGLSVYSHPEGERQRPKTPLKCRMYIGGAPIENTTVTPQEIESLNRLTPGHYRVEATNGAHSIVEVRGQLDSNRTLERLFIVINAEDPNRDHFGKALWQLTDQCTDANRVDAGRA